MPNLTSVGLTAGLGTSGTGTISTLDNLIGTAGTASPQVLSVQGIASGTTIPVSLSSTTVTGTVAVTESGTWTVQPGNTANTTAWKVDGSAVNQPVNIQLAGTAVTGGNGATAAGTPRITLASDSPGIIAVGTAGTPASQVLSIQGVASGTVVPVSGTVGIKSNASTTGTQTSVASSASDVTILASNVNRLGAGIFNDSTQILYLLLANATSSTSVYTVQLTTLTYYEVPFGYTGIIKGIWASANGNARVTELT